MRLSRVYIESLDWAACVKRYDRAHTFFFIDPPYLELAGYESAFPPAEYEKLAGCMASIKGKAMLTINEHPVIRKLFSKFRHDEVNIQYTVGGTKSNAKKSRELIFYNWG